MKRRLKLKTIICNIFLFQEISPPTSFSATADHDYIGGGKFEYSDFSSNKKKKRSYIVEDVPPQGYGYTNINIENK